MPSRVLRCSWDQFRQLLRNGDGVPIEPLYRGQAEFDWRLVEHSKRKALAQTLALERASAGNSDLAPRRDFHSDTYRGQLKYYRHLATGLPGTEISSLGENDLEALARHNGLCTNLLDWTRSPYVAAFFAFSSALDAANGGDLSNGTLARGAVQQPMKDVGVWRLADGHEVWKEGEFECFTSLSAVNYWQKAQSGLFTRLTHPDFADLESYLADRHLEGRLEVFRIAAFDTMTALADLKDMNITHATLFPDLRGAALHANFAAVLETF